MLPESLGGLAAIAGLLGLCIGSFLNVVIHRLPKMMEQEWQAQCAELRGEAASAAAEPLSLAKPRSRCPNCGHQITAIENIPLISYLLILKGKCSGCHARISPRSDGPTLARTHALRGGRARGSGGRAGRRERLDPGRVSLARRGARGARRLGCGRPARALR